MADDESHNRSSFPLRGAILCCTSIPPEKRYIQSELASCAQEMGAIHKLDLTSDVTHLLVGNSDTPKYKYVAKERPDVKVLDPAFIDAIRALWIQGDEIDLATLEERHRLPVFASLRVCLTGFDDPVERTKLQNIITSNGGSYHGDLTKHITHLIANRAEGDKYKYAMMWTLKVVTVEWIVESLMRGMILEESLYSISMPREERGNNAWIRRVGSESSLGKRLRDEGSSDMDLERDLLGRRKLRRTASNKLRRQNSGIWDEIVAGGASPREIHPNAASRSKLDTKRDRQPLDGTAETVSQRSSAEQEKENHQPAESSRAHGEAMPQNTSGIFRGSRICTHGFDGKKTAVLSSHLASNGANVAASLSEFSAQESSFEAARYIVVPHNTPIEKCPDASAFPCRPTTVTEWWIERCLHRKSWMDPSKSVICRPFAHFPIGDLAGMTVSSTAFSGVDLMHVSKVARLMGAVYDEYLSPQTTVLVCNTPLNNKDKLYHAREWSVPAVTAEWLWDSIESGRRLPFKEYLIVPTGINTESLGSSVPAARPQSEKRRPSKAYNDRDNDKPGCERVLHGCILCISSKLKSRVEHLQQIARSLGATVVEDSTLSERCAASVTHVVHPSNVSEEVLKDYENAEPLQKCIIVPPDWLHRCADRGSRADEDMYPRIPAPKADRLRGARSSSTLNAAAPISNQQSGPSAATIEPTAPTTMSNPSNTSTDLTTSIAALLSYKQQNSTTTIEANPSKPEKPNPTNTNSTSSTHQARRKPPSRLLGRASSHSSSGAGRSFSRASSVDSNPGPATAHPFHAPAGPAASGFDDQVAPEPSQKVLYDDPEGREQRERVLRKMQHRNSDLAQKSAAEDTHNAMAVDPALDVGGVGVVKDRDEAAGVGSRTRARGRGASVLG